MLMGAVPAPEVLQAAAEGAAVMGAAEQARALQAKATPEGQTVMIVLAIRARLAPLAAAVLVVSAAVDH